MHFDLRQSARVLVSCILITVFALPPSLLAQTHVVSPADLQREVMTATRARQNDIDNVKQFFSSKAAEKVLKSTHIDPEQVKAAVSTLSDA
jgi:hypothetical protein